MQPEVLWAQRSSATNPTHNIVYLTINLPDIIEETLKYCLTPTDISFGAKAGRHVKNPEYSFSIDLFEGIVPEDSTMRLTSRSLFLALSKKEKKAEYWPRLTKQKTKLAFVKRDFSRWVDEDEQDGQIELGDKMMEGAHSGERDITTTPQKKIVRIFDSAGSEPQSASNDSESKVADPGACTIIDQKLHLQSTSTSSPHNTGTSGTIVNFSELAYTGETPDIDQQIMFYQSLLLQMQVNQAGQAEHLARLGDLYATRFERFGEPSDERQAYECLANALHEIPDTHMRKVCYLDRLGRLLLARFERLHDSSDVSCAITHQAHAVSIMQDGDPKKPLILSNLGNTFLKRFDALGGVEDLHEAVLSHEAVLGLLTLDHRDRPMCLQKLANAYSRRWEYLKDVADIDSAVSNYEKALHATPSGHPDKPPRHHYLGSVLVARSRLLGNTLDLDRAIRNYDEALSIVPNGYPHRSGFLHLLGNALASRFKQLGNIADIQRSISSLEVAVRITSDGHPAKAAFLSDLGDALFIRAKRFGDIADLEKAIPHLRKAVSMTPNNHCDKHEHLNLLGNLLSLRFKRLGDIADLHASISSHLDAVHSASNNRPAQPGYLNDLGIALYARFERFGDVADLEKAISHLEHAIRIAPDNHWIKARLMNTVGTLFCKLHECSGDVAHVDNAIKNHKAAMSITCEDEQEDTGMLLNNLGNSLFTRFQSEGDLADLNASIWNSEMAKQLTPDDSPRKPDTLNNLGISFFKRFDRLGDIIDLDRAVEHHEASLSLVPNDHPDKRRYHTNLSNALYTRCERLGAVQDVDSSIFSLEAALLITPEGHSEKPYVLHSLGAAFWKRYEMLSNMADLVRSIESEEASLSLTPNDHPEQPVRLTNLAISLEERFRLLGNNADLDRSVTAYNTALKLVSDQHPYSLIILSNAALSLLLRFKLHGDMKDMEDALAKFKAVVDAIPDNHPLRSKYFQNFGNCLMDRFSKSQAWSDLVQGLLSWRESARSVASPPSHRYEAALLWSKIAHLNHSLPIEGLPSALDAYSTALDLLPRLAWRGLSIDSQYQELLRANTLACDAAAAALMMDNPEKALEWLEQGRSVVWGQNLQLRSPFDDLRQVEPELANDLANTSKLLEQGHPQNTHTDVTTNAQESTEQISRKHRQLADDWEKAIERVRELPGFESFLRPREYPQLRQAAAIGPVVVLNVSTYRCDALILDSQGPLRHVPLENFTYEQAQKLHSLLRTTLSRLCLRDRYEERRSESTLVEPDCDDEIRPEIGSPVSHPDERSAARVGRIAKIRGVPIGDQGFKDILAELWNAIVKPVLDCFGLEPSSPQHHRRIWWCPTGPLAFLPIHAAGLYRAESTICLADYAISSYTPTLNALLNSARDRDLSRFKLMAVIQPSTPGASSLPGTEEELKYIRKHAARFPMLALERKEATVGKVLSSMEKCSWVHLACHGVQDMTQPAKSALLLDDGRLELSEIIKHRLPHAEFAFLSACQTATGDESRPDEAIHLAAGMLLAGYRGVIGTMWSINDNDAPFVANEVYGRLLKEDIPDSRMAATALHAAVKRLRDRHQGRSFASWVPFIHVGL